MLRSLNYPRLISLENFVKPNFELIADILYWLVQRYDPQADISDDINQEKDRVEFIKGVVTLFTTKARIKLICMLAAGKTMDEIRRSFEWVDEQEAAP